MNEHDINEERLELALEAAGLDLWENDLLSGEVTRQALKTFAELGYPDAIYELFLGLMAPAKTPAPVIKALSDAFEAVKKEPEFIKRLEHLDQELPTQTTPEQFTAFLKSEESRMKPLLKNVQT